MSRFYVPPESIKGETITIGGREAHHIVDVMRLSVSDEVVVFDGTGTEYAGVIRQIKPRQVIIEVLNVIRRDLCKKLCVTLIQAVPKKDRMDYIVEKATELGVDIMMPVMTCRTIPQWTDDKAASHLKRWRSIAQEAAKQCGRSDIPRVDPVCDISRALRGSSGIAIKLVAALSDDARPVKDVLRSSVNGDAAILIGPEGDFTQGEMVYARECGFIPISPGTRILKSDTAGLAVLSMVNYEFAR